VIDNCAVHFKCILCSFDDKKLYILSENIIILLEFKVYEAAFSFMAAQK